MIHMQTTTQQAACVSAAVAATLLFSSCASISVRDGAGTSGTPTRKAPSVIYVEPFSLAGTQIKEHPMRKNPGQLGNDVQTILQDAIVKDVSGSIGPARAGRPSRSDPSAWVVSGRITRIEEGSRILRMGIGLGAGGTKLETTVVVADAKGRQILQFSTTGGSNALPGAATNPIPFSSLPTALLRSSEGVTDDGQRTARMISARLGQYLVERGWIDSARVKKPKMAR